MQEIAATAGTKAVCEVVQNDDSVPTIKAMAVRMMFGERFCGEAPPAENRRDASRLASQAVLGKFDEADILEELIK